MITKNTYNKTVDDLVTSFVILSTELALLQMDGKRSKYREKEFERVGKQLVELGVISQDSYKRILEY